MPLKQREELQRECNQNRKRNFYDQEKDGPSKKARPGTRGTDDVNADESPGNIEDCNRLQAEVHCSLIIDMEAAETLLQMFKINSSLERHTITQDESADLLETAYTILSLSGGNHLEDIDDKNCSTLSTVTQTDNLHQAKTTLHSHFVDVILAGPMHYTGVKSKQVLQFIFSIIEKRQTRLVYGVAERKSIRGNIVIPFLCGKNFY